MILGVPMMGKGILGHIPIAGSAMLTRRRNSVPGKGAAFSVMEVTPKQE
jgi:hypothetical protein